MNKDSKMERQVRVRPQDRAARIAARNDRHRYAEALQNNIRTNALPAVAQNVEVLASGEVDAAVQTPAFTGRWDNYWIEGK